MPLPNLLASRAGRLFAFFCLYLTEGIPLGFTATAVATQMRRQDMDPQQIGRFVATLYLPWAWKWLVGPVVDVVYVQRFGRRRGWILAMQILMALALAVSMGVDFVGDFALFTGIILVMNCFGATQDVAIDALAVQVLSEKERGVANGFMFAGAYIGNAVGGSGVLYLTEYAGFSTASLLVLASVIAVTLFIVFPMREPKSDAQHPPAGAAFHLIAGQIRDYVMQAFRAFTGTRQAMIAVAFALLPAGALSLSLSVGSNIPVEFGMSDGDIANLGVVSAIISALGCIAGGWLSDRLGRRKMIAIYILCTTLPVFAFAAIMHHHGWIMPIDMKAPDRPIPPDSLIAALWYTTMAYALFQGLMYGTRTALFMDVCTPAVAATQFTAYMALLNLTIAYSTWWQGSSAKHHGYPTTLALDAALGIACLALLPFLSKVKPVEPPKDGHGTPSTDLAS